MELVDPRVCFYSSYEKRFLLASPFISVRWGWNGPLHSNSYSSPTPLTLWTSGLITQVHPFGCCFTLGISYFILLLPWFLVYGLWFLVPGYGFCLSFLLMAFYILLYVNVYVSNLSPLLSLFETSPYRVIQAETHQQDTLGTKEDL